jgi:hypothetical protein
LGVVIEEEEEEEEEYIKMLDFTVFSNIPSS